MAPAPAAKRNTITDSSTASDIRCMCSSLESSRLRSDKFPPNAMCESPARTRARARAFDGHPKIHVTQKNKVLFFVKV